MATIVHCAGPASVQEMADFVALSFDLVLNTANPVMMLADGVIGQMMEKVVLPPQKKRLTDEGYCALPHGLLPVNRDVNSTSLLTGTSTRCHGTEQPSFPG